MGLQYIKKIVELILANRSKGINMVGFSSKSDGSRYSGKHAIIEAWGCKGDMSPNRILEVCEEAARKAKATILFSHVHPFDPSGSSGVVILAESHITFHTWEEEGNYIAFDIFMCGDCDPQIAADFILDSFEPDESKVDILYRGVKELCGIQN